MANIKFSQFTEKTTLGTVDFLVGYKGAENVQISPTNLLSTFVSGSGTAGQVAYFDPSNNLAGENDFFWDYTNKRLGIGTNSPTRNLVVSGVGSSASTYIKILGDTSQEAILELHADNDAPGDRWRIAASNSAKLQIRSNGSNVLSITSSENVGIGTTNPVAKLQVEGSFISSGISQLGSGGANVYLTSSSAGSVGIGTSSPGAKLQITGSTSDTSALAFIARNSSNISLFSIRNDGRIDIAGAAVFATSVQSPFFTTDGGRSFKMDSVAFVGGYSNGSDANGANDLGSATNKWRDIYISGDITSSAGGATFAGSINTTGKVNIGLPTEGNYFEGGSGGVRKLTITTGTNTSPHALHTFNIASSNGKYKFDVNGTEQFSIDSSSATFAGTLKINSVYTANADANDLQIGSTNTGNGGLSIITGSSETGGIYFGDSDNNDAGRIKYVHSSNSLLFDTNRTNALTINSSQNATFAGRVIIQDTDTESFRINGTSATGSFVRYQTNGTNIGFFGAAYHLIGSSPAGYENDFGIRAESDLRFTIGASEKMCIINNGNVGIGTNSPTAKLTVASGDVEVTLNTKGIILKSPDGTRYRITVANGGTLTSTAI